MTNEAFNAQDLLLMDEVNMERFKETPHLRSKDEKLNEATAMDNQVEIFNNKTSEQESYPDRPVCVKLHRVSANWINGQLPPTLCNVSAIIEPGELCALVGPVGSGKSSVLQVLLKELNPGAGSVIFTHDSSTNVFHGKMFSGYLTDNPNLRISYASQEPWLFGGTVRDNILFGQPFNRVRYTEVVAEVQRIKTITLYICIYIYFFRSFLNLSVVKTVRQIEELFLTSRLSDDL